MIRLTLRGTDDSVAPILLKLMEERLAAGVSTAHELHEKPSIREMKDIFGNVLVE
jgi:AP-2 complex subunit alpha